MRYGERARNFHTVSTPVTLHLLRSSSPEALRILSFWVFMEASLHSDDRPSHWPLADSTSSSSHLPQGQGWGGGGLGLKVPVHCSHGWFSWHLATVLGCFPKVPSLNRPLYHSPLRKCWGLGSRESGIMSGDQIHILMVKYVFLINHAVAVKSHGSVE